MKINNKTFLQYALLVVIYWHFTFKKCRKRYLIKHLKFSNIKNILLKFFIVPDSIYLKKSRKLPKINEQNHQIKSIILSNLSAAFVGNHNYIQLTYNTPNPDKLGVFFLVNHLFGDYSTIFCFNSNQQYLICSRQCSKYCGGSINLLLGSK